MTFDELYLNAGWRSIIKMAPVIDEAKLINPYVHLVRNQEGTYNFQDIFERMLALIRDDTATTKYALFNLQIVGGRITIEDHSANERHEITDLRLVLPALSSLAADVNMTVLPEVSARINGAPIGLKGQLLPFKENRATAVEIDLDRFDLARVVDYFPIKPLSKVHSAVLNTRLVITFELPRDQSPTIKIRGAADLTDLDLRDREDRPMISCPRIEMEINEINALAPTVDLKTLVIDSPDIHVRRDSAGVINLERAADIAVEGDRVQRRARRETGKAAVGVKFGMLSLKAGRVHFTDETTDPAFKASIYEVQIDARDFDNTLNERSNHVAVQARTEAGESLRIEVDTVADPRGAEGRLEVSDLALKGFQPYLNDVSNLKVDDGRFDIDFDFRWASDLQYEEQELDMANLGLELRNFRARLDGEKEPLFRVTSIKIDGAGLSLGERLVDLGSVKAQRAAIKLRREKDGSLNLAKIPRQTKASKQSAKPQTAASTAEPWRVNLGAFSLDEAAISLEDRATGTPVRLRIAPVRLEARNLSNAKGAKGTVALEATIGRRGRFTASGPLTLRPLQGQLRVDARTVSFALAQPYVEDRVRFTVTSGVLSAKGITAFSSAADRGMKMTYQGNVRVTDFKTIDNSKEKADLVNWKSLSVEKLDLELEPLIIGINQIELVDFYGNVEVSPDGSLNLMQLVKPAGSPSSPSDTTGSSPNTRSTVQLGSMRFKRGTLDFTDSSVKPTFRSTLRDINGSLTAMTPDKASAIQFTAKGQRAAVFGVRGQMNPLGRNLYLDIEGTAKDVELPPLSMYAVKYVGYPVERGKLTLNVNYRLHQRQLEGNNNIVLEQVMLGEKVEGSDAIQVPLPAAIAILKNRKGVVDLDVPISGSFDDPQFSISGAVVQAFGAIVAKAVTAPFALLGATVGGGAELSYIEFAPGSATLDEADIVKLSTLVKALNERPGVNIDVRGRADPESDREALSRTRFGFRKKITDDDLHQLAEARAEAARSWLVNQGRVPANRVFLVSSKIGAEGLEDSGKPTRVDFRVK